MDCSFRTLRFHYILIKNLAFNVNAFYFVSFKFPGTVSWISIYSSISVVDWCFMPSKTIFNVNFWKRSNVSFSLFQWLLMTLLGLNPSGTKCLWFVNLPIILVSICTIRLGAVLDQLFDYLPVKWQLWADPLAIWVIGRLPILSASYHRTNGIRPAHIAILSIHIAFYHTTEFELGNFDKKIVLTQSCDFKENNYKNRRKLQAFKSWRYNLVQLA